MIIEQKNIDLFIAVLDFADLIQPIICKMKKIQILK